MSPVVFRVDASAAIGLGHLARSATLAEAVAACGSTPLFVTTTPDVVAERIPYEVRAIDAAAGSAADGSALARVVAECAARHVVVDGYVFGEAFRSEIAGTRTLWIDDNGFSDRRPGLVLNQHFHATDALYPGMPAEARLLGPRYALVRDAFVGARAAAIARELEVDSRIPRILVTMGGSDPPGATAVVLDALDRVAARPLDIVVIVGPANPRREAIAARRGITVLVDPPDLAGEMARADLAITAAGGTAMELACIGVPALVVAIAGNQRPIAAELARRGMMRSVGSLEDTSVDAIAVAVDQALADREGRTRARALQRAAVDGEGKRRVARRLVSV